MAGPFGIYDLAEQILLATAVDDLQSACNTNSTFRAVCDTGVFWKRKVTKDFSRIVADSKPPGVSYKEQYGYLTTAPPLRVIMDERLDAVLAFGRKVPVLYVSNFSPDDLITLYTHGALMIEDTTSLDLLLINRAPFLEWLIEHTDISLEIIDENTDWVARNTVEYDDPESFAFLVRHQGIHPDHYLDLAISERAYHVLAWMDAHGVAIPRDASELAIVSDDVAFMNWLWDHGIAPAQDAVNRAIMLNNTSILDWLWRHGMVPTRQAVTDYYSVLDDVVVEWLFEHRRVPFNEA